MAEIPDPIHATAPAIYAAIEARNDDKPRPHLGASQIGHPCERWLWLSFRWAARERFDGRMLRLFRRGQDEEARVVEDLRAAGMDVQDVTEDCRQIRVSVRPHFSGSMDGKVHSGVPEAPHKPHILEIKTSSKKLFDVLVREGVQKCKPEHYAQMQTYMGAEGIDRALYIAVCKDDDRIYAERVRFEPDAYEALREKAERIITTDRMPEPLSADPTWYQCKWCAAHSICHQGEPVREANCRTCAHVSFTDDGVHCERWGDLIPTDFQRTGCRSHVPHPDMVPWRLDRDSSTEWTAAYLIDGRAVMVGEDGRDSREVLGAA